eukprot:CAMPEP_0114360756 /NCGR_PEP_ID=MMETSP0101-20121206/24098_1 /TAXON_ID=38822 ORGANISM="Pteridomonas danica, Strain PT" /NCGR_SAMPLE_ID=MMETSP0101 /ASSEMBLY_ACC=CAM_ASM_000211 /LENGTH=318 /DNA_ID=CAMNT_0001505143 /DNA_START=553 /DNA_END=1509 /DNA_ORIENTATION=+
MEFRCTMHGLQYFTIPFYGTWRILCRGAFGGNFAMQQGGKPAEFCGHISSLIPGQTLVLGVGEGGHLGGGGGASFVAVLDKGLTINDEDAHARLLVIVGGGGGAGFLDGVEASCHKKSENSINGEPNKVTDEVTKTNNENNANNDNDNENRIHESKPVRKGGHRGKGIQYETASDGSKVCSMKSLHKFAKKVRYGGMMGGGNAADAFSLSGLKTGPVMEPADFTFLAGSGGGGGYRGGEGGALAGAGGGSFVDRSIIKTEFFRISTANWNCDNENIAEKSIEKTHEKKIENGLFHGNGMIELSIPQRIYQESTESNTK